MSFTGKISASIVGTLAGSNPLGVAAFDLASQRVTAIAPGTGSGQADIVYSDRITLSASATQDLDLAGGVTSPFGVGSLSFVKVKGILVLASATNSNNVLVGNASNPFLGWNLNSSSRVIVPPGGVFLSTHPTTGWDVTADTGDTLRFGNSAGGSSVEFDVVIIGTSE